MSSEVCARADESSLRTFIRFPYLGCHGLLYPAARASRAVAVGTVSLGLARVAGYSNPWHPAEGRGGLMNTQREFSSGYYTRGATRPLKDDQTTRARSGLGWPGLTQEAPVEAPARCNQLRALRPGLHSAAQPRPPRPRRGRVAAVFFQDNRCKRTLGGLASTVWFVAGARRQAIRERPLEGVDEAAKEASQFAGALVVFTFGVMEVLMFEVDEWLQIRDLSRLRMEIRKTLRGKPTETIETYLRYADQQMMMLALQHKHEANQHAILVKMIIREETGCTSA
jgi:hypothetical protein